MQNEKFALLIDSENISARYISVILDEVQKYGVITYKRIYGDWTSSYSSKWKDKIQEYSITPIQQFRNTTGKNSTDSALIIDAMDILYTHSVDGFCIVSSDGDFTRLASRLRESGMQVIGMGEEKTPRSFCAACSVFTNLDILYEQDVHEEITDLKKRKKTKQVQDATAKPGITKEDIENTIINIVTENENKGKPTELAEVGNRLLNKYPDFDVRKFGYSLLTKFLREFQSLDLNQVNNIFTVSLRENKKKQEEIQNYIIRMIKLQPNKQIGMNELSNKIHMQYKNFNVKDYGFATFTKYIQSIKELDVIGAGKVASKVFIKSN